MKLRVRAFNKQGSTIKNSKFYCREKEIEIARQYTYLITEN